MVDKQFESISSFPLQWPVGWKRTPLRQSSQFKNHTIAHAVEQVLAELKRMGIGDWNVIISTNLSLRLDGLPYSNQKQPEDVGVSVWWRVGDGRKVIALDKYERVADNLYAVAKTIGAMRGIDRWGSGEILERTFEGFEALPNPDSTSWREILGYKGDDYFNCKKIYREKIKESHPDNGGDPTAAAAINDAWEQAKRELAV